jgi:tape measure domain-containing protein
MGTKVGITVEVNAKNGVTAVENLGKKAKETTVDFTKFEKSLSGASKTISNFEKTIQSTSEKMLKLSESARRTEKPVEKVGKEGAEAFDKLNRELAESAKRAVKLEQRFDGLNKELVESKRVTASLGKELDKLKKKGEGAGKGIGSGVKKARKGIIDFDNSVNLATIGLAGFVFGTIKLAKGLVSLNDEYSLLRSQIRLVVDDSKNLVSVQEELLQVANDTRQGFSDTVKLYARLDRATEQLFLTDKQVIAATETLNKAIIISGASASESSAAIIQLSQGLASGALRGDELRSVLEQVPRVAKLIADGMGIAVGSLREFGTQGKLTAEVVIDAIKSQSDVINEEFGKIEKTSAQTWTVLTNNAESYVTKLTEVGAAQKVFNGLLEVASKAFESLNEEKTLEIAQATELENRSLKQQWLILNDIRDRQDKVNAAVFQNTKATKERRAELLLLRVDAEIDLIAIQDREKATADAKAKEVKQAKEAEDEKLRLQAVARQEYLTALEEQYAVANEITNMGLQVDLEQHNENERAKTQTLVERLLEEDRLKQQAAVKETLRVEKQAKVDARIAKIASDAKMKNNLAVADQSIALGKEVFGENKAFTIAEIGLSTARGVMSALGSTPPNPILAGLIGATGVVQAGKASGIKLADGTEFVDGAGSGRSDSIPAMLSKGERVVPADINSELGGISNGDLLTAIRGGGGTNITIHAGAGTDIDSLAQAVTDAVERANVLGLEPQG